MRSRSLAAIICLTLSVVGCAAEEGGPESATAESAYTDWGPYGEKLACR